MSRRGIIDTGPLVAFIDGSDGFHDWTVTELSEFDAPLATCDAVITEAWHLLKRARRGRESLLGLLRTGALQCSFSINGELAGALRLLEKYADQPMSIADACLVRMAELDTAATILTLDSDFAVYRRGRSALRVRAPFND